VEDQGSKVFRSLRLQNPKNTHKIQRRGLHYLQYRLRPIDGRHQRRSVGNSCPWCLYPSR